MLCCLTTFLTTKKNEKKKPKNKEGGTSRSQREKAVLVGFVEKKIVVGFYQ